MHDETEVGINSETLQSGYVLKAEERSEWTCYLFGNRPGGAGLSYIPEAGHAPNFVVRFFMRICLDCLWIKNTKQ